MDEQERVMPGRRRSWFAVVAIGAGGLFFFTLALVVFLAGLHDHSLGPGTNASGALIGEVHRTTGRQGVLKSGGREMLEYTISARIADDSEIYSRETPPVLVYSANFRNLWDRPIESRCIGVQISGRSLRLGLPRWELKLYDTASPPGEAWGISGRISGFDPSSDESLSIRLASGAGVVVSEAIVPIDELFSPE